MQPIFWPGDGAGPPDASLPLTIEDRDRTFRLNLATGMYLQEWPQQPKEK
jgi:hypothetical protein